MAQYNNKLGELRPNQIITTFGPGSIIDAVKDSVTMLDTSYWTEKGKKIIDGRLASYLGVDCFYMPRSSHFGDVPVTTFPYFHVCSNSKCGRLFDARPSFDLDRYLRFGMTCPVCHKPAYPSRFITICEDGHMSDFPWHWWVHRGNTTCTGSLKMYSIGNTSTLADMWVECSCGARRSMSGATQKDNFEGLSCPGHHPFRPHAKRDKCKKELIPSQRGASNVYFSVTRSAISIPPWINPLYNLIDEHLRVIEEFMDLLGDEGISKIYEKYFSGYPREEFDAALTRRLNNIQEFTEIKRMEYDAITHHNDPVYASNKKHFKAEEEALPEYLKKYFNRIIRITRLREVKVLLGFTRVDAPDPDADEQANIVYLNKGKNERWLPAVEINGEGIFIQRVLRSCGFTEVKVTKASGDGGIDGTGKLRINGVFSFNVAFQCKRYKGSVGAPEVRDFRGSLNKGTEKAVLITTGTFTKAARQEAADQSKDQIDLIDGEELIDLIVQNRIGVSEEVTYRIDESFFLNI